jgi:uncharacterized metal-binding protein YceD (DUF177 family)
VTQSRDPSLIDDLPLSRPLDIDSIRPEGLALHVATSEAERAGLAVLFKIPGIPALEADLSVTRKGSRVRVIGEARGIVTRECVLTLDPFDQPFTEAIDLTFDETVRAPKPDAPPEEDSPDPIINGMIDLGAVIGEFVALGLDPYPRKPGAAFPAELAQVGEIAEVSPFAALAQLRKDATEG